MSLATCKECGGQVSTKAKSCPHCGAKLPKKTSFVTWSILVIVLLGVYGRYNQTTNMSSSEKAALAEQKKLEAIKAREQAKLNEQKSRSLVWVERGKTAVKERLKDPASAQFKDVFYANTQDGLHTTCGQVNAKNAMGGYAGFQYFISAGSSENTYLENEVADFKDLWTKLCSS